MLRVKFYSVDDMVYEYYLRKSEEVLNEYLAGRNTQNINDIIELYNIIKYFESKSKLPNGTLAEASFDDDVKSYKSEVAKVFRSISDNTFELMYKEVESSYKEDFWELINKFKVYENISECIFRQVLNNCDIQLRQVLIFKGLTVYFGNAIRDFMLHNYNTAELLIDKYEIRHLIEKAELHLPKELSILDKEEIINSYIDSEEPNLNYLNLIARIKKNKDSILITDKTLLKAKKRAEEIEKNLFKDSAGLSIEVVFSNSQNEQVKIKLDGQNIHIVYSGKWISENKDYIILLNNFNDLFGYMDTQLRFTLVNKFNMMNPLERFAMTTSKNAYITGTDFMGKNSLSLIQLRGYYNYLLSIGIRLETVIEWFFNVFVSDRYGVNNFRLIMPSKHSTFLEKCTNIMPALESVLKQFCLLVEEGKIDHELLEIRSEHLFYDNIPSMLNKKYIYGHGNEFKKATFLLFSDQSHLPYDYNEKKHMIAFLIYWLREKLELMIIPSIVYLN